MSNFDLLIFRLDFVSIFHADINGVSCKIRGVNYIYSHYTCVIAIFSGE